MENKNYMDSSANLLDAPVILVTVSSKESFGREVSEALKQRFCSAALWHVAYDEAARLRTVRVQEKSIVVIEFGDAANALALSRAADGLPQLVSIAVGSGRTRDELLQLMQAG